MTTFFWTNLVLDERLETVVPRENLEEFLRLVFLVVVDEVRILGHLDVEGIMEGSRMGNAKTVRAYRHVERPCSVPLNSCLTRSGEYCHPDVIVTPGTAMSLFCANEFLPGVREVLEQQCLVIEEFTSNNRDVWSASALGQRARQVMLNT